MRKFIINGMNIGYVAPNRSIDVSYDNTKSGLTATNTQDAIDELTVTVNSKANDITSFTEASTRENIVSGESHSTIFGKIKKFFSDLKTVAFSGSYNDLSNKPGVTSKTSAGFCPQLPNETATTKYLRQDGSWQVPPDNNTTYSAGTGMGLSGTSFYLPIPRVAESCNALPGAASLRFREYTAGSNYGLPTNAWYQILEIRSQDANYGTQLALGMTTDAAYYRKYSGGSWGSWYSLINTNTTYSGSSTVTLSGTTFSLTKANVTTALGYTPPTSDTNTVTSFTTKTFEFNVSIAAGGDGVYTPNITNSGWTPLGVVGVYAGNIILCPFRWGLASSTQARIDIHNYYSATSTSKASVTILYYKNS